LLFGWGSSHGNDQRWVGGLWPHGVINAGSEFVAQDGSVGMKFGWWRAATGTLQITGGRLDAPPRRRGRTSGAKARYEESGLR
jgi:hypothetical protein